MTTRMLFLRPPHLAQAEPFEELLADLVDVDVDADVDVDLGIDLRSM